MRILDSAAASVEQAQGWARARGGHQRFIDVIPIYYRLAPLYGVAADVATGQAAKETDRGHYSGVVGPERHNWCGLKRAEGGSNDDPDAHATFASDEEGVEAHLQHLWRYAGGTREQLPAGRELLDPRFDAVTRFTQDVEGFGGPGSWAPSPDYGHETAAVVADLRAFAGTTPPAPPPRVVRVALAAGHHNTSGGNATEIGQTGPLTQALARACRARGIDVRVVQPDGPDADAEPGDGTYAGDLAAAAGQVVAWDRAGWPVDLFLEVHTEGAGGVRGAFAIYPDWPADGDLDAEVRDTLGPDIVARLGRMTGLPARGNGVMSERRTGVGLQGYRLGVFRVTAPLRDHTTRLIVEYGAHDHPGDLAIWQSPSFLATAAAATADAIAAFYGVVTPAPAPDTDGNPWFLTLADGTRARFAYRRGFRGFVELLAGARFAQDWNSAALAIVGQPVEDEWPGEDGCTYQRTSKVTLQWIPGNGVPWDVVVMDRDAALPARKGGA